MEKFRGIVLAGGSGTRFYPVTRAISKQLLPVYNKPLIYYPLSVLMLAGIRKIAIITNERDRGQFETLLEDGSQWGLQFAYFTQDRPEGIAQAFLIARDFIAGHKTVLILGDNLFFGHGLAGILTDTRDRLDGASVFAYRVNAPEHFGVVELDHDNRVLSIEEKPAHPRSNLAVTGLYMYDEDIVDVAASIQPSARGELEITDVNKRYLERGRLSARILRRGFAWLDTGTPEGLLEASSFVATMERRQNTMIAALEEIAWRQGWISDATLERVAAMQAKTTYGAYLASLLKEPH